MRNTLLAIVLGSALALGPAGPAALAAGEQEAPEALMREGMERMLRGIELMIKKIPQFEMPEVTEDGDIIIRRKRRPDEPPPDDTEGDSQSEDT